MTWTSTTVFEGSKMPKTTASRPPVRPPKHRKHHRHDRKQDEALNEGADSRQEAVASGEKERSPKTSKRTLFTKATVEPEASLTTSREAPDPGPHSEDALASGKQSKEPEKKPKHPASKKSRAAAIIHRGFVGLGQFGGKRTKHRECEEQQYVEVPGVKGVPVSFLVFIIVVVLVIAGLLVFMVVKFFRIAVFPKKEAYNCSSGYCLTYGRFLVEGVRDDVHPCDDFYQHVCGKWEANRAISFMEYARKSFSRVVARAARATDVPRSAQTPAQKAAQFFKSCDDVLDHMGESRRMLNEGGLSWPDDSSDPDVLAAIFYSSTTLYLPAIIHVTAVETGEHQLNLHLRRADTFKDLARKQEKLMKLNKLEKYIQVLNTNFADPTKPLPNNVQDTIHHERVITPVLMSHMNDGKPLRVSVDHLESVTRGTFKQSWREATGTYITMPQNSNISVTISDKLFFDAFCNLTRSYGEVMMHRYVSWYAVQNIAKLTNLEVKINHYGTEEKEAALHAIHCATLTEELLGVPFMVPYLQKLLYPESYQKICSMAEKLALITDELLTVQQKHACKLSLGPPGGQNHTKSFKGNVTTTLALQDSNDSFDRTPDMSQTFLLNWILANKARDGKKIRDVTPTARIYLNELKLADSVFYGASVSLPPWVLLPPVFAPNWSAGFQYGGLGGELAAALTACTVRIPLDEKMPEHTEKSPDSAKQTRHSYSAFAPFPVINVLTRALMSELRVNASTDDDYKRMFVQWCYMRCGNKLGANMCNRPLRDSALFSRLFACRDGRHMTTPRFK